MTTRINSNKIVLAELSYKIIEILFKVHNELGSSLLEKYDQRAVAKELSRQNIRFIQELAIDLDYQGISIGRYKLDFIVEGKIILELKANKFTDPRFFKQVLTYLKTTHLPLAVLANFRRKRLDYRRIVNSEFKDKVFE